MGEVLLKVPLNDLSRADEDDSLAELDLIKQVLKSGIYLKSKFTKQLEEMLSIRTGGKYVLGVANGTEALKLAFLGLGLQQGDLVLTTPNSGGYASTAAFSIGMRVGLIDVDPKSAQASPSSLVDYLKQDSNVKALVVTHLFGQIGEIEEILEICIENGVRLIEDCAQSYGAEVSGKQAGSFGDAATFSFYPTKNLGAAGDAGAVAFIDEQGYDRACSLAQYGWGERYQVEVFGGFNSRIDEIQSAILIARNKKTEVNNSKRREIVKTYSESTLLPRYIIGSSNKDFVGHLAVLITTTRDQDAMALSSLGIETGIHYPILDHEQPAWSKKFRYFDLRNSELLVSKILTLPCFPNMSQEEINHVASSVRNL
jgi:dTDP-4-amino-4,6-dideoxygalactose transaminase